LPVVLPSTLLGVAIYRRISDVNFRKVTFGMLGGLRRSLAWQGVCRFGAGRCRGEVGC
jgi:hypothetical protein